MANCCNTNFIEIQDFYGITNLSENVDATNLAIAIRETQIKYIKPLFCTELYDELVTQVDSYSLSTINAELMCYIKDIQVRYAFADFLRIQPIRITKESVVRKVSNESEFVSFEENANLAKWWRDQASNYIKPLRDFMDDNVDLNPLYKDCTDCSAHADDDFDWGIC
jgi:hypothetical protein